MTAGDAARTRRNGASASSFLWAAVAVLLLASLLRFGWLMAVPPGLSQDEVLNADIVSFIRQGERPLFFREGYGHEPLYHYLATPFQPLLGDNVLSIRLPAGFLGLLLIAGVLRWARRGYGRRPALLAGALLAISWWPIIFSRLGLRAILLPLLLVAAAYFWPFPGRDGQIRRYTPWLAGLFLGLSSYSYTAARVVLAIPVLYAGYLLLLHRRRPLRAELAAVLLVLGVAAAVSLPLYLTLRADPTLFQRDDQLAGPLAALQAGDPRPVLATTLATLGVFSFRGDPRWTYSLPGRALFDPLTALFFYGGLLLALWRSRRPRYAFLLIWLAVGLVPSAVTPQAPSTIRLVAMMPVTYLLPALALDWSGRRLAGWAAGRRWLAPAGALLLAGVLALNLGLSLRDGFGRWPAELETRLRYQTVFRDIAAALAADPAGVPVIAEAYYEPIDHDSVRRSGGGALEARWVQQHNALVFPAGGGRLYVPEFAAPAGALMAAAGLDRPRERSAGPPSFAVYELPAAPAVPLLAEPVTFYDPAGQPGLRLLGYQRLPVTAEGVLPLLTYWQVLQPLPADLATFAHLLAEDGTILAQYDGLDAVPAHLQPGDTFLQLHPLPLPGPFPAGEPLLVLGLYARGDGVRWTRPGEPPDRYLLR